MDPIKTEVNEESAAPLLNNVSGVFLNPSDTVSSKHNLQLNLNELSLNNVEEEEYFNMDLSKVEVKEENADPLLLINNVSDDFLNPSPLLSDTEHMENADPLLLINNVSDVFLNTSPSPTDTASQLTIDMKLFTPCRVLSRKLMVKKFRRFIKIVSTSEQANSREVEPCYGCIHCEMYFDTPERFNIHFYMIHSKNSLGRVKKTGKNRRLSSTKNENNKSNERKRKGVTFQCEVCKKLLSNRRYLGKHMETHQIFRKRPYNCDTCKKSFYRSEHLQKHLNIHDGSNNNYQCDICGRQFSHPWALRIHVYAHINYRPISCSYCQQKFITTSDLKKHVVKHTKENRFVCLECGKAMRYSSGFKEHLRKHYGKLLECEYCLKKFRTNLGLKKHIKFLHSGKTPYFCELCHSFSETRDEYFSHKNYHISLMKFCCDFCGKGWNNRGEFFKHMQIHLQVKNKICTMCPAKFVRNSHLKSHIKSKHKNDKMLCTTDKNL